MQVETRGTRQGSVTGFEAQAQPIRAAIYARKSTSQEGVEADGKSVAVQVANARTFAAGEGVDGQRRLHRRSGERRGHEAARATRAVTHRDPRRRRTLRRVGDAGYVAVLTARWR